MAKPALAHPAIDVNLGSDAERAMKLENKVAIVTGAARGIGLAIVRRYVAAGAKVILADVDAAAGEAAADELGNAQCRFIRH